MKITNREIKLNEFLSMVRKEIKRVELNPFEVKFE